MAGSSELLTVLLKQVSRSFYLTLRALPASIRPQIGLAYLLARTTDTIADTALLPVDQRLEALRQLRDRISGASAAPLDFGDFAQRQGSSAERTLLERTDDSLALLQTISASDLRLVRQVLEIITSGQELDLRRFAAASVQNVVALRTDADLDDYAYRVAGCVGEFWTHICHNHVFPSLQEDSVLLSNAVRFGKGLQMVNILRDLASDVRQGRCYLPSERLCQLTLGPCDLLNPGKEPALRPLYNEYLDRAEAHLQAGWTYTNTLPWRSARVRLACSWPVLIGLDTLRLLRSAPVLDPASRVKISRKRVRKYMLQSVLYYPWPAAWRRLVPGPLEEAQNAAFRA